MPRETQDLHRLTLAQAARLIRRRQLSPRELTVAVLDRASSLNPRLNAYLTLTPELALRQAAQAEARMMKGDLLGPLDGIPIGLKDLFATKGIRTTAASLVLKDWVPDHNAAVVERLYAAGAVMLGKTHMHEFAFGVTNVNQHYGPARNPWDPQRMTGGSSGGSAAAVAAGMAVAALGTDTGGSIRIPAAMCGVVGLKPTYGLVSRRGAVPLAWSLDHVGPLARTVEDAALLLTAIAGHDSLDPGSADIHVPSYTRALRKGVKGMRFGVLARPASAVDHEAAALLAQAHRVVEGLGGTLEEVTFPALDYAAAANTVILMAEAAAFHQRWLDQHPDRYGDDVLIRLAAGRLLPASLLVTAQRVRSLVRGQLLDLFRQVDVLLWPVVPVPAPLISEQGERHGAEHRAVRAAIARFTPLFNLVGFPALSVPCGFTARGLPIGLQMAAAPYQEPTLLRTAFAYEQAADWHKRMPPL
ncbi:MAG: amidase [Dehalococcoidia bacterium]|nr:amidase [Dehalococcoidia bacterium]